MSAAWGGKSLCFTGHGWSRRSSGSLSFLEGLLLRHLPRQQEGPRGPEGDVHLEKAAGPREPGSKSTCVSAGRKLAGPGPPRTGSCDNTRLSLGGI